MGRPILVGSKNGGSGCGVVETRVTLLKDRAVTAWKGRKCLKIWASLNCHIKNLNFEYSVMMEK